MKKYDDFTIAIMIFFIVISTIAMITVLGFMHFETVQDCIDSGQKWSNNVCWEEQ